MKSCKESVWNWILLTDLKVCNFIASKWTNTSLSSVILLYCFMKLDSQFIYFKSLSRHYFVPRVPRMIWHESNPDILTLHFLVFCFTFPVNDQVQNHLPETEMPENLNTSNITQYDFEDNFQLYKLHFALHCLTEYKNKTKSQAFCGQSLFQNHEGQEHQDILLYIHRICR